MEIKGEGFPSDSDSDYDEEDLDVKVNDIKVKVKGSKYGKVKVEMPPNEDNAEVVITIKLKNHDSGN